MDTVEFEVVSTEVPRKISQVAANNVLIRML